MSVSENLTKAAVLLQELGKELEAGATLSKDDVTNLILIKKALTVLRDGAVVASIARGMNANVVARIFGLTPGRVSQINALAKLKGTA